MAAPDDPPCLWVLHDGKIGMANQVIGLAEAVGWPFIEKRLAIRSPWRHLPPQLWLAPFQAPGPGSAPLDPPWPAMVIACGRNTVSLAWAIKRASGGNTFWVQVQDPRFARRHADLIVAPRHDPAPGDNVFRTLGAVHRVTAAKLAAAVPRFSALLERLPRPLAAVLIGGNNGVYRLTEARFAALCDQLAALAASGTGLAITPSRRTPPEQIAMLRKRLEGLPVYLWDGSGENPYFALLGLADAIIATADSVSMISEAAATGKPVYIVELDGGSKKFARFHAAMRQAGITRSFAGEIEHWQYLPLQDTALAADEIRRRFQASR